MPLSCLFPTRDPVCAKFTLAAVCRANYSSIGKQNKNSSITFAASGGAVFVYSRT
jgi:hypothetical protein